MSSCELRPFNSLPPKNGRLEAAHAHGDVTSGGARGGAPRPPPAPRRPARHSTLGPRYSLFELYHTYWCAAQQARADATPGRSSHFCLEMLYILRVLEDEVYVIFSFRVSDSDSPTVVSLVSEGRVQHPVGSPAESLTRY